LTFDTFAADLITLLDALHIKQVHLVGFSDGAITALHTAIKHPKRILSMVLLGANYTPRGFKWFPYISVRLVYAWLCVVSLFAKSKRLQREIWGLMVYLPNLTIEEIGRIRVPALVITGENDMVSQRQNDGICRAIAGSKRLVVPGGDHFWMFKQPDVLNNTIMDFLNK
jgi:pimeloyl-ACP methyl ester carboxylesterase